MSITISGKVLPGGKIMSSSIPSGITLSTIYGNATLLATRHGQTESVGTEVSSLGELSLTEGSGNIKHVNSTILSNFTSNSSARVIITNDEQDILFASWTFGDLEAEARMIIKPSNWIFTDEMVAHWEHTGSSLSGSDYDWIGFNATNRYGFCGGRNTTRLSSSDSMWEVIDTGHAEVNLASGLWRYNDNNDKNTYIWMTNP